MATRRREAVTRRPRLGEGERYWLAHSEGFRVEAPGGRVGLVEAVLRRRGEEAEVLVVRAGLLGRQLLVVPATAVAAVAPRRRRITLAASPEVGRTDFLAELLRRFDNGDGDGRAP